MGNDDDCKSPRRFLSYNNICIEIFLHNIFIRRYIINNTLSKLVIIMLITARKKNHKDYKFIFGNDERFKYSITRNGTVLEKIFLGQSNKCLKFILVLIESLTVQLNFTFFMIHTFLLIIFPSIYIKHQTIICKIK